MFYQLLKLLAPDLALHSPLSVFGYTTVRAACAFGFALFASLLFGPFVVRRLRALKAGQQVRHFKTADTRQFNIHQHKAGTPTMGGVLIVGATFLSALLFCSPANSYVWLVQITLLGAAALGFADDYLKIARKDHRGVSAKSKLAVQCALGGLLGAFLLVSGPHTFYGSSRLDRTQLSDPAGFGRTLARGETPFAAFLFEQMPGSVRETLRRADPAAPLSDAAVDVFVDGLNAALAGPAFYQRPFVDDIDLPGEARSILESFNGASPSIPSRLRLHRLMLETAFPEFVVESRLVRSDTHLVVPFFKNWYPDLGVAFILWAALVIAATSNAVNLTDGLDGLAIGTVSVFSLPYVVIAYLVSRYDFSAYLYVPTVPQAAELGVFLCALLGAGFGFLWFNAHPAEVFMGDTGSLSIGAAIGAVALLCKHEVLVILIGGVFVVEALSVVLQVGSWKLRGKRVLLMSPLHNHFVKKGMDESKIIARFLIVATILALAGLSTLKLR